MGAEIPEARIGVVVPCYRVRSQVLDVIAAIPSCVSRIYVVDDACPEISGDLVAERCVDGRVTIIRLPVNQGVGGAVMAGYKQAVADDMDVVVKIDGDGQMDPAALPQFVGPIIRGDADYTKGNRFYDLSQIGQMPRVRVLGNAVLSFLSKLSSGYWNIFDPTNGYTAIHTRLLGVISLEKISRRYFFETDMLFRLNIARAVVIDVPMNAKYGSETSNLRISRVLFDFSWKHARNAFKRVFYSYFLRDMSLASAQLLFGVVFVVVGAVVGITYWVTSHYSGVPTTAGGVMLAALQVIVGIQMILGFLAYDIASVPVRAIYKLLPLRSPFF